LGFFTLKENIQISLTNKINFKVLKWIKPLYRS